MEQATTQAAVAVSVDTAVVGTIESVVSATGVVQPAPGADLTITAPEAARIAELLKAEGDTVAAGDVLVRFDIPTLPAELEAKRAAVRQAEAQIKQLTYQLNLTSSLVEKGVTAQREVQELQRQLTEAQANLAQARSAVAAAETLDARATVRAKFAGVVVKRWHNPGDMVEGAVSDPVIRIVDPHAIQVVASIPVVDIARVVIGHGGFAIGPSGEAEPIRVVNKTPQVDVATAMAEARLVFTKATALAPGTPVQILITAESHEKAVIIPAAALVHDEDEVFVMVIDKDNKAHRHDIVIGLKSPDRVEILSGIAAGDVVAIRGQDELPEGGTVTIVK